jgi:hypothetical protein
MYLSPAFMSAAFAGNVTELIPLSVKVSIRWGPAPCSAGKGLVVTVAKRIG